jgi:hypothetical protein
MAFSPAVEVDERSAAELRDPSMSVGSETAALASKWRRVSEKLEAITGPSRIVLAHRVQGPATRMAEA